MALNEKATALKEQGNNLFSKQKDYRAAHSKYTAAIKEAPDNAVLYVNRAACSFMLRNLDLPSIFRNFSLKGTELDPSYPKAWYRLGVAQKNLGQWEQASNSLLKARSILLESPNSSADQKMLLEVEAAARDATLQGMAKQSAPEETKKLVNEMTSRKGDLVWERARKLLPRAQATRLLETSVWTVCQAEDELKQAITKITKLVKRGPMIMGELQAFEVLSNCLITERRAFYLDPAWARKLEDQATMEITNWNGWPWPLVNDPAKVIEQAKERVRTKGWESARPALSVSVRILIVRACLTGTGILGTPNPSAGIEMLENALKILLKGRNVWSAVPTADRGVIFEQSFIRGVRRLLLSILQDTCRPGAQREILPVLEHLRAVARDQLNDLNNQSPDGSDLTPGFINGFFTYPLAEAISAEAVYHQRMALFNGEDPERPLRMDLPLAERNADDQVYHLRKASELFLEGAKKFPPDDEKYVLNLALAVLALGESGTTWATIKPIIEKIQTNTPLMLAIWQNSAMGVDGEWSETKIQDAIAAGENIPITEEYIRAWYRLGLYQTQLGQWEDAKVSLDKARQLLSAQATPIDKSLHQGVEAATRDLALKCSGPSTDDTSGEQLIWYKALMILPLVECSQRPDTSVWTICHAQEAFERGFALTRKIRHGDDGKLTGELTAIAQLTNALVTERRVVQWHINHELSRQIKDQVNFEVSSLQGWPSIRDTNTVIEQARFRIRATGWASVRPMLDISVRSAILIGCLQCGLAGDQSSPARKLRSVGIAVLEDALRLLLQGQSAWKSVPINDKGHIFQDLFVRGVRRLVIDALQDFCGIDGKADPEILPALHNLRKEAIVQVSDVEAHHVDSLNPWARTPHTINGFWTYPLAEALCAQGLYHLWIAQFPGEGGPISSGPTPSDTPNPATPASKRAHEEFHLRNAARFFFDGGYKFPSDDEKHVYNLALGIISQCDAGTNLPQILPIINRIRSTVELMTGIWKSSTLTRERRRNQLLTLVLCLPELIKTKIERAEMQPLSQFRCCLNENGSWQFH
ncbi:TPR-like protein [Sistotremastrum suecicum HHB10207 ss-3]|uniref:TPR-like protein n=1 Tax=Sistotremastrum suecicum HHB10207 ss-3 TaxID=1314776 RepID=A0A165YE53_9AGAM|nr:TPR-like protein [Sistotremastrum suecicum HHB10207 ss-3]